VPAIEGARTQSWRLQLFRRPAVLLETKHAAAWTEVKDPPADPRMAALGRPAQCFRTDESPPGEISVRVLPNRPHGRSEQVIRLAWDEDGWKAAVDCRLEITSGLLDEVVIDAPAAWNGPFQSSADVALKVTEGSAEGHRLLLEPRAAVAGAFHFAVSSPLELSPADHVVIPEVLWNSIGPVRRVLVLPKQAEGQPVAWETQGLRGVPMPEAGTASTLIGMPPPASDRDATAYEIVAEQWKAIQQPAGGIEPASRIRLADLRMAWQGDGSCRGLALLDAEIEKSAELPLWLPAGARLLHLTAGGVPIDPVRTAQGAWLVPLAADPQPQRLEVLFTAGDEDASQGQAAAVSAAAGMAPGGEESLQAEGTLQAPPGPALETLRRPIPLVWATRRVFHGPRLGDLPIERTVWTIAGPRAAGTGEPEDAEPIEPEPAAEGESPAAERQPPSPLTGEGRGEAESSWPRSADNAQTLARYAGHADSITLRYAPVETNGWLARLAAVLTIGLLAAGAVVLVERGALWHGFARWPHAFGVALGLGWWLFLRPSGLGLLIVLAVLAAQFLPRRAAKHRVGQAPRA
jgi:hypothetical protein